MNDGTSNRRPGARTLMALLVVSGAAALAHEVVWVRLLTRVFGSTAGATAVVLGCFMGGMGLGSFFFGRRSDRSENPLRLYGILQIAAGALALAVPLMVGLTDAVYGALFRAAGPEAMWLLAPARVALASVVLVPPSLALGGTLPVLVRLVSLGRGPGEHGGETGSGSGIGFDAGRLYAANTAGAVAGCFAAGFALLPWLGIMGSALLAGGASIAVGAAAIVLSRRASRGFDERPTDERSAEEVEPPPGIPAGEAATSRPSHPRWVVPVLYGASGFVALGCEVLWTRALVFLLRSTVYAFTAMLTVYLVGLAAGGAAGAYLARRVRRPALAFAALEAGVAASVALGLVVLGAFAAEWLAINRALESGWGGSVALHLALSAAVMIVPTFLLGMLFPVAARLHSKSRPAGDHTGGAIGELLLANTAGGVAGSLAAGFVMIRLLGTAHSILALACMGLFVAAGAVALLTRARRAIRVRALVGAGLVAVALFVVVSPEALRTLFAAPNPRARLVHAGEGPGGIVTVHRYAETGYLLMSVNGVSIAGTSPPVRSTQVLQGLIPVLAHGRPRRVLQVGIGTGETSRVVLAAGAHRLTCVEISPAVVRATRKFFGILSGDVLGEARYDLVYADARNYLRHTRERFDLVLSDSTYPFLSGSSALYTLDYFRDCRARLAAGGLASAWLPLDLPERGHRSLLRTFAEAFPHATLWTTSGHAYKHALLLGSNRPITMSIGRVKEFMTRNEFAPFFDALGIASAGELAACLMLDRDGMLACGKDAPLHTDDHPVLAYETALRAGDLWRERLADNLEELNRHRPRFAEATTDLRRARHRASEATDALVRRLRLEAKAFPFVRDARRAWRLGRKEEAFDLYRKGIAINPADEQPLREFVSLATKMGRYIEALEFVKSVTGRRR